MDPVYACPHCNSTKMFMAVSEGALVRVLEDPEDVEGLEEIDELLCTECNQWFANPVHGAAHTRVLTGELVLVTGLNSPNTIKIVATGLKFPFHYDSFHDETIALLKKQDPKRKKAILDFADYHESSLAIRTKEDGKADTWIYRLDKKRVKKAVQAPKK